MSMVDPSSLPKSLPGRDTKTFHDFTKNTLHELLLGFDPYLSCGVPKPMWKLARRLTKLAYGRKGVALLDKYHKENQSLFVDEPIHVINGWDDSNTQIGPKELIEKLKRL